MSRLERVLEALDQLNRADPNLEGGRPEQLVYAEHMTERLSKLEPAASDELRIAVRAQHVCRWRIPRSDYPSGRSGYKRWRSQLARMHADLTAEVMEAAGYDDTSQDRVRRMLQKRGLKTDAEVQALEDCACLVFLQHYFAAFATKHPRDKLVDIVRKTWAKMSARAQHIALDELAPTLPPDLLDIVQEAVAG